MQITINVCLSAEFPFVLAHAVRSFFAEQNFRYTCAARSIEPAFVCTCTSVSRACMAERAEILFLDLQ